MKLTEKQVYELLQGSTFGAEMEAPNWNTNIDISDLAELCDKEFEIINYKGICNDPKREYNKIGAEIKVKYSHSEEELVNRILEIWDRIGYPEITASPTLHIHIRPHKLLLDENVELLKKVMNYTFKWAPELLPLISPLPEMKYFNSQNYPDKDLLYKIKDAYQAKYRHRHGKYTKTQMDRVNNQNKFEDVINALTVKNKAGQPSWNIHTRGAFNFAKLRESDGQTFEFRMWSLTQNREEIEHMVNFPKEFIKCALLDLNPIEYFKDWKFPPLVEKEKMDYYSMYYFLKTDGRTLNRTEIIEFLKQELESKKILLSDLGYPDFWKTKLENYQELYDYSKSLEK